jgi:nucleoside-diphosphate-sugar epimerase
MVKILIIGATGYIGYPLALALRQSNHTVYGMARSASKAKSLATNEIIPVLDTAEDFSSTASLIRSANIDLVIDLSGGEATAKSILPALLKIGAERSAEFKTSGHNTSTAPKLGFIYCSGIWVHGSSLAPVNDLMPVGTSSSPTPPAELTKWRADLERSILSHTDVLDVLVVRPALLYGGASAIWSIFLGPILAGIKEGKTAVEIAADPASVPGLIHLTDTVSGFVAAVEKLPLITSSGAYPVFDLQTSFEPLSVLLAAAGREMGFKGEVILTGLKEGELFPAAMCTSVNNDSVRAKTLLGWKPTRTGFLAGMNVYANAWKATNE